MVIRSAALADLDPVTLYSLLQLRVMVFVVEQHCPYPELDGRDLEPGARHLWMEEGLGRPVAYLRLLDDAGALRIGRVVTAPSHRGQGLAARLVATALADTTGPVTLDAQAHLQTWYEDLGFRVSGPSFVDDGIPHVPMRLDR